MINNVIIMTVKGRKDLTETCLRSLAATMTETNLVLLIDSSLDSERVTSREMEQWFPAGYLFPIYRPDRNIPEAWNMGFDFWGGIRSSVADDDHIWFLNNDVEFKRSGWLKLLSDRMDVPGTGMVGAYSMSVFGLPFTTGGIWGILRSVAMQVLEDGKLMDERLHYCCQDVDLSVRVAKAGFTVTHVPGMEYGPDPYLVHGISQTVSVARSNDELLRLREPERRILIDKHGRNDGRSGYDGVVEGS